MTCDAEDHEILSADDQLRGFIDCQDKIYVVCIHCAALWDGENWLS